MSQIMACEEFLGHEPAHRLAHEPGHEPKSADA